MTTLREKRAAYARKLVETEQFEKAISLYNRMVADDPTDVDALQKLAGLHLRRAEFAKALSANERIAEHHYRTGKYSEAATVYEVIWILLARHAPELRAGYSLVPQRLGEILSNAKSPNAALKALDRLLVVHHDLSLACVAARLCLARGDRQGAASALAHLRRCFKNDFVDVNAASLAVQAFDQLGQAHKGTVLLKESARIAWRIGDHSVYNALVDALAARDYADTAVDIETRRERIRGDITVVQRPEESVTNVDVPVFDESLADYSVSQEISADDLEVISADFVSVDDLSRVEIRSDPALSEPSLSEPGPTEPFFRETLVDVDSGPGESHSGIVAPTGPASDDGATPIPLQRRVADTRVDLPPLEFDDDEVTPTEIDKFGR